MRVSRLVSVAAITSPTTLVLATVPAQAGTLSSDTVNKAYDGIVKGKAKGGDTYLWVKPDTTMSDPVHSFRS